jgi:hypothetical protein
MQMVTATADDIRSIYAGKGKYLNASDLNHQVLRDEIVDVPVLHLRQKDGSSAPKTGLEFRRLDKVLPLNSTNIGILSQVFGPDPLNWIGKHIELYTEATSYGPGIRVRPIRQSPQ